LQYEPGPKLSDFELFTWDLLSSPGFYIRHGRESNNNRMVEEVKIMRKNLVVGDLQILNNL